jgi:hypothetical protein
MRSIKERSTSAASALIRKALVAKDGSNAFWQRGAKDALPLLAFTSRGTRCLTTRQYARLVSAWIGSVGLDYCLLFGTHSLRRDSDLSPHRQSQRRSTAARITKIESTVSYLGIEVDDALAISEQVDV